MVRTLGDVGIGFRARFQGYSQVSAAFCLREELGEAATEDSRGDCDAIR